MIELFDNGLSDKIQTGMAQFYVDVFGPIRKQFTGVCEIGIDRGGSILAWLDFFPNAKVYGLDNRASAVATILEPWFEPYEDRVEVALVDAGDLKSLMGWINTMEPECDLIIDDGSHRVDDIDDAYYILWNECLQPGGYYVIEDTNAFGGEILKLLTNAAKEQTMFGSSVEEISFRYGVCWMRKER